MLKKSNTILCSKLLVTPTEFRRASCRDRSRSAWRSVRTLRAAGKKIFIYTILYTVFFLLSPLLSRFFSHYAGDSLCSVFSACPGPVEAQADGTVSGAAACKGINLQSLVFGKECYFFTNYLYCPHAVCVDRKRLVKQN